VHNLIHDYIQGRPDTLLLNIGSESGFRPNVINLDIVQNGSASVLGDATRMPFRDESFDAILNIAVMEHVRHPETIAAECLRVLKPGGRIYCAIPFFQMFHPDPIDMQRYTIDGITNLFSEFNILEKGIELGPASATALTLREFFAILFSFRSKLLYDGLQVLFGYLTWPIKFLDHFLVNHRSAYMIACSVYMVGEKPSRD
jgi:SAM-dependent methyltransferase